MWLGRVRPLWGYFWFVKNEKIETVAAGLSIDACVFEAELTGLLDGVAGRFASAPSRARARALVQGLVAPLETRNCWTLAEWAGHSTPDKVQYLLERARFDHDGAMADLRGLVCARLADPDAVLVVDETGDVKKGTGTVGVQRQYTGTAGRIENAQVAVYLTYAAQAGYTFIDRRLYLPKSWTTAPERLSGAGVPAGTRFATKPALATAMITGAHAAGVPARWVAGDEVYGADPALRATCRSLGLGYVLAVASNRTVPTGQGSIRVDDLTTKVPQAAWFTMPAGVGAKGLREYAWALIESHAEPDGDDYGSGWHYVLVRRNLTTSELAWYRCWSPDPVTARTLVLVAGRRWTVEENFQTTKNLTGLDQHQVRRWVPWHRWTFFCLLAHAFLTLATLTARTLETSHQTTTNLVRLSLAEVRRLWNATHTRPTTWPHVLAWSWWRRHHQHQARQAHYKRKGHPIPDHPQELRL